jgi:copper chaperone
VAERCPDQLRIVEIISPAGFERFFQELSDQTGALLFRSVGRLRASRPTERSNRRTWSDELDAAAAPVAGHGSGPETGPDQTLRVLYGPASSRSQHHDGRLAPTTTNRRIQMNKTNTYSVPEISSGHCRAAIAAEIGILGGVSFVEVDLDGQRVTVTGPALDDGAIRAAIYDAGYEALPAHSSDVDVVVVGAGQAGLAVGATSPSRDAGS